jgi:hypothetical protein
MECRMSSSDKWSCQVSIRWEFDDMDVTLQDIREERFGNIIESKDEVEVMLRRPQAAVLKSGDEIYPNDVMSVADLLISDSIPFSRNIVCVDIEGLELTDLSFIDLPGPYFYC